MWPALFLTSNHSHIRQLQFATQAFSQKVLQQAVQISICQWTNYKRGVETSRKQICVRKLDDKDLQFSLHFPHIEHHTVLQSPEAYSSTLSSVQLWVSLQRALTAVIFDLVSWRLSLIYWDWEKQRVLCPRLGKFRASPETILYHMDR